MQYSQEKGLEDFFLFVQGNAPKQLTVIVEEWLLCFKKSFILAVPKYRLVYMETLIYIHMYIVLMDIWEPIETIRNLPKKKKPLSKVNSYEKFIEKKNIL